MSKSAKGKDKNPFFYSFLRVIISPIMRLLYLPSYIGRENIPTDKSFVLCCNHVSLLDPVFLGMGSKKQLYFMAKKELFSVPILSSIIRSIGTFPVDRKRSDMSALRNSMQVLGEGKALGIFPEGTRSKTGEIGQFKAGAVMIAAKSQVPIVPAAIYVKKSKMRLFSRPVIIFGKPLTPKKLDIIGKVSSEKIHSATEVLTERVKTLRRNAERSLY